MTSRTTDPFRHENELKENVSKRAKFHISNSCCHTPHLLLKRDVQTLSALDNFVLVLQSNFFQLTTLVFEEMLSQAGVCILINAVGEQYVFHCTQSNYKFKTKYWCVYGNFLKIFPKNVQELVFW